MSAWFKSCLNPWYIWIPSNPNLYSTKIIMKMRWQTIASNVSIRTISSTATPLPKAYDCSSVYCGPPHPSRRIMVGGRSRQPKRYILRHDKVLCCYLRRSVLCLLMPCSGTNGTEALINGMIWNQINQTANVCMLNRKFGSAKSLKMCVNNIALALHHVLLHT